MASRLISLLRLVLIALIFAAGGLFFWARPFVWIGEADVLIRIEPGESASSVARKLRQNKILPSSSFFMALCVLSGKTKSLRPGAYLLTPGHYWQTLKKLESGDTYRLKVTFPEGWSSYEVGYALLQKKIINSIEEFLHVVKEQDAEGFLFPETYFFEPGITPKEAVATMRRQFDKAYSPELIEAEKAQGLTRKEVVTIASIVERETRLESERALVAQVYRRRLKIGMGLEADPTVQYAIGEGRTWPERLRYKDLKINSPYNTYKFRGLPPGPICNPGLAAIRAALFPSKSDYLYFVADGKGGHKFSRTFAEHVAFRKSMQRP